MNDKKVKISWKEEIFTHLSCTETLRRYWGKEREEGVGAKEKKRDGDSACMSTYVCVWVREREREGAPEFYS